MSKEISLETYIDKRNTYNIQVNSAYGGFFFCNGKEKSKDERKTIQTPVYFFMLFTQLLIQRRWVFFSCHVITGCMINSFLLLVASKNPDVAFALYWRKIVNNDI